MYIFIGLCVLWMHFIGNCHPGMHLRRRMSIVYVSEAMALTLLWGQRLRVSTLVRDGDITVA